MFGITRMKFIRKGRVRFGRVVNKRVYIVGMDIYDLGTLLFRSYRELLSLKGLKAFIYNTKFYQQFTLFYLFYLFYR